MKLFSFIAAFTFLFLANKEQPVTTSKHFSFATNDTLPSLPEPPNVKRGWVGQFLYTVKLNGSGNQPKPYSYYVNYDRIHTGYVELSSEIKGAMRANAPDRYNEQRWESWLPQGSKKSWSYINDSLHQVTVITSDQCCLTPHDNFRTTKAGSVTQLKEGVTHGYDLQIDYSTGAYILSMPLVRCDAQQIEIWKVNKDAKPKNNYLRNVNDTTTGEFKTYGYFNQMDTIMGTISRGQKEIVIRRTSTITYTEYLYTDTKGKNISITPPSKGTVEFVLTLRRAGG
ncbi:MAG: hypothetical protein K2X48_12630 [Chitinophagaceae bacterium]|nr:hypothetical protein [Chitinophagaceae bacterium]